jgi:hypothetical protein
MDSVSDGVAGGHMFFHTLLHGTVERHETLQTRRIRAPKLDLRGLAIVFERRV